MLSDCTLSITVARTDLPFLQRTVSHQVRGSACRFARRVLVLDTQDPKGTYGGRPGVGTAEDLERTCADLCEAGVVDDLVAVDRSPEFLARAYKPLFSEPVSHTTDFRGYPHVNILFSIEEARTPYLVHFDSDMLVHQRPGVPTWIERGIEVLQKQKDIVAVLPLSGPPHPRGRLLDQPRRFYIDARGFYRFDHFTTRVFLIDRARFATLRPLVPRWPAETPLRQRVSNLLRRTARQSTLPALEMMLSRKMQECRMWRADLPGPHAWSLHPCTRDERFFTALGRIIEAVEKGQFPAEQAGHYDLELSSWLSHLA